MAPKDPKLMALVNASDPVIRDRLEALKNEWPTARQALQIHQEGDIPLSQALIKAMEGR